MKIQYIMGWGFWLIGCWLLAYFDQLKLMWPIMFMILAIKFLD